MPKRASPLEVYALLPKINCGKCGEKNCMAFAIKLLEKTQELSKCTELDAPKYKEQKLKLYLDKTQVDEFIYQLR